MYRTGVKRDRRCAAELYGAGPFNTLVNRSAMQNGCKPFFGIYMIIDRIVNRCYTVTITKAKRGNHYVL